MNPMHSILVMIFSNLHPRPNIGKLVMNENGGVNVRDVRYCLLCGSRGTVLYTGLSDRLFDVPGTWMLMRCQSCQLIWLNPQPTIDDVKKLYAQYFTHQKVENAPHKRGVIWKKLKASILLSGFGYQMEGANKILGSILCQISPLKEIIGNSTMWLKASEKGRLLDVGCGNGLFLNQMERLGWKAVGVEQDGEAVSIARERYGLQVFRGSLEEAKFPEGHFDAITMNHVIEHVLDPIGLLKECRRILKPDGKLVMVTPNSKSLGLQIFDEDWRGLEVPRHMYLFSPHAMRACAGAAGLAIQELRTTAKGARWMWAACSLLRQDGANPGGSPEKLSNWVGLQGLAFQAVEYVLCGFGQGGEELVITATR